MKKRKYNKLYLIVLFVFIAIVIATLFINRVNIKIVSKDSSVNSKNYIDDRYTELTPTIIPAATNGWKIFIYPDSKKRYTFEFPETWILNIKKDKYAYDNEFDVALSHSNTDKDSSSIIFMTGGRGGPNYESSKTQIAQYGGRTVTKEILYREGEPFEIFVSFNDNKQDSFVGIDIQLPRTSQQAELETIEKILSSLKFYY